MNIPLKGKRKVNKNMAMIPAGNGEGPSSMYPKRQRRNGKDIEGEDHEKEEVSCRNGSITWTVSDPEVFDCPVCFEPLAIPVFQVFNKFFRPFSFVVPFVCM